MTYNVNDLAEKGSKMLEKLEKDEIRMLMVKI